MLPLTTPSRHFDRSDAPLMIFLGALGVTIPQCVLFAGVAMAGPQVASCIQPSMPVSTSG